MPIVYHRFLNERVDLNTETLILGTFNPEAAQNSANYYYSRPHNHLWKLLPLAKGEDIDLRGGSKEQKLEFCYRHKIAFVDLIFAVSVPEGTENNYNDAFIDSHVYQWYDIFSLLHSLHNLKRVYFTRKTFNDIPSIRKQVESVKDFCTLKGIVFTYLPTPARIYSWQKQLMWNEVFGRLDTL